MFELYVFQKKYGRTSWRHLIQIKKKLLNK